MALWFKLILFLASWKCTSGALDSSERPLCNQTVVGLRALREMAQDGNTGSIEHVLCVTIPEGKVEVLNYFLQEIKYASVIISGNGSVVKCVAPLEQQTQYPLFFTNSSLVVLEGVHIMGCTRPLRFKWVTRIEIVQSTFTNFTPGGALEISNSPQVIVSNCTFTNNTSLGIGTERYSGNAGAVAIGYDDTPIPEHLQNLPPAIRITGSIFKDNNSTAIEENQYSVAEVLGRRIYNQRGGAIANYFGASNYSADVEIVGCTFEGNYVRDSGGAVYMFLSGEDNGHSVKIRECDFTGNAAKLGGGAELTFDTSIGNLSDVLINQALIEDCMFKENRARDGGGFSHIQINKQENLNNLTIKNCSFVENEAPLGSALSLKYIFTVNYNMLERMVFIVDCTFQRNSARYGVLFTSRNTISIEGNTTFHDNIGPAIQSFGSLLTFSGHIAFTNNRNHPEGFSGVINLAAFGQIMLQRGVNISFLNNTGVNGGALVVTGQLKSTEQLYNPHCFLQYEDSTAPPPSWNISMLFEGNEAEVGPVMYASSFTACTWVSETRPFFNADLQEGWAFIDIEDNYLIRGERRSLRPDYYFQTSVQGILFADPPGNVSTALFVSPGESIEINVQAKDGYSHNTTAFLELKDASAVRSGTAFEPSIVQTVAGVGQIEFKYRSINISGNTTVQLRPSFVSEELPGLTVTLVHSPCLPGYFLRDRECTCEETDVVALCDPQRRGVLLVSGLWGAPPNWSRELVTHICPPGYCDCSQGFEDSESIGCLLNYTNPDEICIETRKGQLCGQCREGYGVGLLTNDCKTFHDKVPQFWLFPIYLGVLIPLLVVIVKLGVHLPTILRGFIFYIQISPIAVEFLPQNFRLRLDVMSCFESIVALYLPYDFNFHEGMTSLESYGLRYVTPLVALIVVPITFRLRRTRSIYWHGVWTIVQLMFIMAVKTSASLLLCPTLTGKTATGTSKMTIWFYDGSVRCFRGWHILLSAVALISLLSLTLFIPLVAAALWFEFLSKRVHSSFVKLESFSLALTRGFKEGCRWWPLVDVVYKYIFVISSTFSLGHTVVPLVVSLLIFLLQFYFHPYKDVSANYVESSLLLLLILLLTLGNTTVVIHRASIDEHFTLWPIFYLPVLVGGVVTTAYIIYHILKLYKQKRKLIKQKYNELISQRISFHKRKARTAAVFYEAYVTKTEICLYDDEPEGTDTEVDKLSLNIDGSN